MDESAGIAAETPAETAGRTPLRDPMESAPAPLPPAAPLKSIPVVAAIAVSAVAWLVPGLGHLVMGRWVRSLLLAASVFTMFTFGLGMQGKLYGWDLDRSPTAQSMPLQRLEFFGNAGVGLTYFVSMRMGLGTTGNPDSRTFDYGEKFLWVAGLLNYLIVLDAFDIARGRKP